MTQQELDEYLHCKTRSELFHLNHPNTLSESYSHFSTKILNNKKVWYFQLPGLKDQEILIRKDSRFASVPNYVHSNINITYVYSGNCTILVDEHPFHLTQGDVCIFDRDVIRQKDYLGEDDIVMNISISNVFYENTTLKRLRNQSIISDFLLHALSGEDRHDNYLVFQIGEPSTIVSLFNQLFTEYFSNQLYSKEAIIEYLSLIFINLMRIYQNPEQYKSTISISADSENHILVMLRYIEEHYDTCTLTDLSVTYGYHPKYISSMLHKQTGSTFKELQKKKRFQVAAQQLTTTSLPVKDIASQIGINNLNSFYSIFRDIYQMTPVEYRKSMQIHS